MKEYEVTYLVNGKRGTTYVRASSPMAARNVARGEIMGQAGIGPSQKIIIITVHEIR